MQSSSFARGMLLVFILCIGCSGPERPVKQHDFAVGDLVQLKSSSQVMVVESVNHYRVWVEWIDSLGQNRYTSFKSELLIKISEVESERSNKATSTPDPIAPDPGERKSNP